MLGTSSILLILKNYRVLITFIVVALCLAGIWYGAYFTYNWIYAKAKKEVDSSWVAKHNKEIEQRNQKIADLERASLDIVRKLNENNTQLEKKLQDIVARKSSKVSIAYRLDKPTEPLKCNGEEVKISFSPSFVTTWNALTKAASN